jgi:hypothetical protein
VRSFSSRFHVYGCNLTRDRLAAVWGTVTKDASDRAISYAWTARGIASVRDPTLDELFAGLDASARLAELEFRMLDPASQGAGSEQDKSEQDKSVIVLVDAKSTFVAVSGPDQTWVLGRAEELRSLLRDTRRRFAGNLSSPALVATWFLTVALLPLDLLVFLTKVPVAIVLSLVGALTGLSLALWRWLRRRNATRIILDGDRRQPWVRADWIAIGILVAGVLSLAVVAYQAWWPKS